MAFPGRLIAGLALTAAAAAAGARALAASDTGVPEEFRKLHAAMRARRDLQFDFAPAEHPEPPTWLEPLGRFLDALAPVMQVVFWAAVALAVGFILYFIFRELVLIRLPRWRKKTSEDEATPVYQPTVERARALLDEADRLAAQGRYAEAARHLLHRSIQDIEEHRRAPLSIALTSREIGRLEGLSTSARGAFGLIAEIVERGLFGARPVSEEAFQRCRRAYADFALPEAWA